MIWENDETAFDYSLIVAVFEYSLVVDDVTDELLAIKFGYSESHDVMDTCLPFSLEM